MSKGTDRLFRRNKIWYGWVYSVDGKLQKFSTWVTTKDAARAVLAREERKAADPDGAAKAEATLADAFEMLFEQTEARARAKDASRSLDTLQFQKKQSRGWLLFCGMRMAKAVADPDTLDVERIKQLREQGARFPLEKFGPGVVDAFIAWRRSNGVAETSLGKDLSVMRPAMRYALRAGKWGGSLEQCFPRHELRYEPTERWLDHDELDLLMAELEPNRAAVIAFAYALGAEPRAIERARREDIADASASWVHVRGTKRKTRDRRVPVRFEWQRELLGFARKHADGTEGRLFSKWSNQRRVLAEACDRAGIDPASLTALRHSFAHRCKAEGIRQEDLAPAMGHTDTKMLDAIYGRATSPAELVKRWDGAAAERRAALILIEGGKAKAAG
jgi:integrase